MARPKKPTTEIQSVDDANRAMWALLCAEVELEKHVGAMDLARAAATAKYEETIDTQRARIADLKLQLQTWYMGHTAELEKEGRKSVLLTYGTLGRRLGNPTLKPLNRAWTWAAIGVQLRSLYRGRFFRPVDPEIDKDLVKAQLTTEELKAIGLKVEQDEKFYVETDRSKLGENV